MIYRTTIPVGAERVSIETEDFGDFMKTVSLLREMNLRATEDSVFRVRKGDHDYFEIYSPQLRAAKKISQTTAKEALTTKHPFTIYFSTPWVKFVWKDGRATQYLLFNRITDDLREAGFEETDVWYPGHYDNAAKRYVRDKGDPLTR